MRTRGGRATGETSETRPDRLARLCREVGLHVATYAPGDGRRRYKFFARPAGYFEAGEVFRCDGIAEALRFAEVLVAMAAAAAVQAAAEEVNRLLEEPTRTREGQQ